MAVEVMMSEFDYFKPEAVQNNVNKWFMREFTPLAALTHGSQIEFAVPGSNELTMDLSKSYIIVRAQITKADDTAPLAAAEVGPVNLTLHSMFSNVDIELGGKMISDPNGLYPYRAYIETLLSYNKEAQETQLQSEMWYKDTAGKMDAKKCVAETTNKGLSDRATVFTTGTEVEMLGRLHADIFHQNRSLPSNLSLKVKLTPSKDKFVIICDGGELYKMVIKDARLFIHTFELTKALALAQEEAIATANFRYPIHRVTMKHLTIPANQSSALHDNIYLGDLPDRLVVGFIADADMAGAYATNPFNFKHHKVNYLALTVNGEMFPSKPYQPDFTTGRYIREYMGLADGMGTLFSSKPISIPRAEYAQGYTFFVFDLTADHAASNSASLPKKGSIRLEVKFAANTGETVNVLLYGEFRSIIEIDKYRNVIGPV